VSVNVDVNRNEVVSWKEEVLGPGHDLVSVSSGPLHSMAISTASQIISSGANDMTYAFRYIVTLRLECTSESAWTVSCG
jgi:hypothetical protein